MGSLFTALSGLQADNTAINVVGDNLANMNTQGFKSTGISFEDAMNQTTSFLQIGSGVGNTITSRTFSQGNLKATNQPLDLAIQGNGFFVVQDATTGTAYTRDGSFRLNSQGELVTQTGALVQGWTAVNGVVNPSGPVSPITVPPPVPRSPVATQNMTISANLSANASVNDTFSTPVQIYDSLGNAHTLTIKFTNTGAGAWNYDVEIPSSEVTGGTGSVTSLGSGNIAFNSSGTLTTPAAGSPVNITNSKALADGAAALNITWSLYDPSLKPMLTGFGQTSAASGTSQDGTPPSTVTGFSFQNGGLLVANFSDASQQTLAQVAVANVSNPDSLIALANNNYIVGADTITPTVGAAGTAGRGNIISSSIEQSNVDMATQFTNLIVFQQSYQANAKVLSTVNQMSQSLLNLNT